MSAVPNDAGGRSRPFNAIPFRESLPCRPAGLWVGCGEARAVQAALPGEPRRGAARVGPEVRNEVFALPAGATYSLTKSMVCPLSA